MFWAITLAVLVVLAVLGWWLGHRRTVTADQLERQRRQLGIHQGKGMQGFDR
jgi:heme exporter protein D